MRAASLLRALRSGCVPARRASPRAAACAAVACTATRPPPACLSARRAAASAGAGGAGGRDGSASPGAAAAGARAAAAPAPAADDDDAGAVPLAEFEIVVGDEEEEEEEEEEGEGGEDEESVDDEEADDDDESDGGLEHDDDGFDADDDGAPGLVLTGAAWGAAALGACEALLRRPEFAHLSLYGLAARPSPPRLCVRLDKPADAWGSPTLDELAAFSAALDAALEAPAAPGVPSDLSLEVSSPGSERLVRVPGDLARFAARPMRVTHVPPPLPLPAGAAAAAPPPRPRAPVAEVLTLVAAGPEGAQWRLADVRANRQGLKKGQPLPKRAREAVRTIAYGDIVEVRLHVDV